MSRRTHTGLTQEALEGVLKEIRYLAAQGRQEEASALFEVSFPIKDPTPIVSRERHTTHG